ncbi:MAG: UDP-N-acetylmuramate dehydrogenase [Dysgonamonadaceae bacterium]|nr:UDP-N-acetylmuramate dehydrogenase [Dysgonamonadaceae bacterium]
MRIENNYSLLKHNTFHLDVKAKYFVEYDSEQELRTLLSDEYFISEQFWHIGCGSNLLFLGDYNGIVVHSAIRGTEKIMEDDNYMYIKVGAGENWDSFVNYCVENNFGGIENLSMIPGEIGAAVVQNIGAYGTEVSESVYAVFAYNIETMEKQKFTNSDCQYSYRKSFFKRIRNRGKYYITYVIFRLLKKPVLKLDYGNIRSFMWGKPLDIKTVRQTVIDIRRSKLPDLKKEGNAGSFFVNPYISKNHYEELKKIYPEIPSFPVNDRAVKIPAAWLIESCGLKGKTFGGAAVSRRHPLIIINKKNATGSDIAALADEIRSTVRNKFYIELTPEVNYI